MKTSNLVIGLIGVAAAAVVGYAASKRFKKEEEVVEEKTELNLPEEVLEEVKKAQEEEEIAVQMVIDLKDKGYSEDDITNLTFLSGDTFAKGLYAYEDKVKKEDEKFKWEMVILIGGLVVTTALGLLGSSYIRNKNHTGYDFTDVLSELSSENKLPKVNIATINPELHAKAVIEEEFYRDCSIIAAESICIANDLKEGTSSSTTEELVDGLADLYPSLVGKERLLPHVDYTVIDNKEVA